MGELFGTDWPEIGEKKLISVPNLSQVQEGLPDVTPEPFVDQYDWLRRFVDDLRVVNPNLSLPTGNSASVRTCAPQRQSENGSDCQAVAIGFSYAFFLGLGPRFRLTFTLRAFCTSLSVKPQVVRPPMRTPMEGLTTPL